MAKEKTYTKKTIEHIQKIDPSLTLKQSITRYSHVLSSVVGTRGQQRHIFNKNIDIKTNSWGWVKSIKDWLYKDKQNDIIGKEISENYQRQWNAIVESDRLSNIRDYEDFDGTPIESFLDDLQFGRYPSPEVMLTIADSFNLYFNSGGLLTLEQAFFDDSHRGKGNFSARLNSKKNYEEFHKAYVNYLLTVNTDESLPSFFEKFVEGEHLKTKGTYGEDSVQYFQKLYKLLYEGVDSEPFLKGYQRWKTENNIPPIDKEEIRLTFNMFQDK